MSKQYDLAVVFGRFQPLHNGHVELIRHANSIAQHTLILLGSAFQAPTHKNPFSAGLRHDMILAAQRAGLIECTWVEAMQDMPGENPLWIANVQKIIEAKYAGVENLNIKVVVVGHKKDESSMYLDWFPQYARVEHTPIYTHNATDVRKQFYETGTISDAVPQSIRECLTTVPYINAAFKRAADEYNFIKKYQEPYEGTKAKALLEELNNHLGSAAFDDFHLTYAKLKEIHNVLQGQIIPFKPVFVTVDAVVLCKGHILLVKRGAMPGKGLWALPGGFLNADEKITPAILRELREETGLIAGEEQIKLQRVFDDPNRSQRGRTITHAGLIVLPDTSTKLPKIKGADDAEKAKWIPLHKFFTMQEQLFEDHFHIASTLIRRS